MTDLVRTDSHVEVNRLFDTAALNDVLEAALKREPEYKTKVSFSPSSLGYNGSCARYWYYAFNGATFDFSNDALSVQNMNNGTAAGQRLAEMLDKAGLLITAELPVTHQDPPIFGYIDAIIDWQGQEVVVEIKTTNSGTWNKRALNRTVPGYQYLQLLLYMYVTDHDRGFFMTENKDTHELFILPVKMTEANKAIVEETLEWMRKVKANADNGQLPTRPFTQSSYQCKGCPVKNTCWEGYQRGSVNGTDPNPGTIEIEVLNIPK